MLRRSEPAIPRAARQSHTLGRSTPSGGPDVRSGSTASEAPPFTRYALLHFASAILSPHHAGALWTAPESSPTDSATAGNEGVALSVQLRTVSSHVVALAFHWLRNALLRDRRPCGRSPVRGCTLPGGNHLGMLGRSPGRTRRPLHKPPAAVARRVLCRLVTTLITCSGA
jgi:hypothetical protein